MSAPIGLIIKNSLDDIEVGDCIPCRYTALTSGIVGLFSELGTCTVPEIPLTGTATPDGLFYFIKTNKGTLIADRVIQTNISWDVLNGAKYIESTSLKIDSSFIRPINITAVNYQPANLWLLCDNLLNNSIIFTKYNDGQIIYQFDTRTIINYYRLGMANNVTNGNIPISWNISGSNDNINYVTLHSMTRSSALKANSYSSMNFDNQTPYLYYKLTITLNANEANTYPSMLAELSMGGIINIEDKKIHSLSGGCAYADENGNPSTTDKGLGAWPPDNEWDKYIVKSDLKGKITPGDDNIWHWSNFLTWCKDTPINGVGSNTNRVYRGRNTLINLNSVVSNNTTPAFRPVLNYMEVDIASEVIF